MRYRILIILFGIMLLTGCSSQSNDFQYEKTDNGSVFTSEIGNDYFFDELPFDMNYNEAKLSCTSVELLQDKTEHGYEAYAIVNVDISSLSDDNIYWIDKDDAISASIYITSENNGLDFEKMSSLCTYDDGDILKYIFWLRDEYRADLMGSELSVDFRIKQNEVYEYKGDDGLTTDLNKENSFTHSFIISSVKSTDDVDKETYSKMSDAFERLKEVYSNLPQ